MDDVQQAKITKFISDKVMSEAVYEVLLNTFLKPIKGNVDLSILAAQRLAIDGIQEAWKELEKSKPESQKEGKNSSNLGM